MEQYSENDPLLGRSGDNFSVNRKQSNERQYITYPKRWFMLAVFSLLAFSNGVMWIMFSPIADITAAYYNIDASQVNWLSLSYMVVSIPVGFVAMWALDTKSLKKLIHLCAWLNLIGSGVRLLSIMETVALTARYPVLLVGQCISALTQPFLLFGTTKLSAVWFPEKERAVANAVSSMANPLGILVANVVSPIIATSPDKLYWVLEASAVPTGVSLFLAYMVVTTDRPPSPPSPSAEQPSMGFLLGLKTVLQNKHYLILCATIGTVIAVASVLSTFMEQILCPRGYSDTFSGICIALFFGSGIFSATVAGYVVDKTRKFVEVVKICFSLAVIFLVAFTLVARLPHCEVILAILISCVGMLGFPTIPVSLEIAVECTYPVSEGTSAGFLQISGQLQSMVYVIALQFLTRPYDTQMSVCHTEGPTGVSPQDYTVPLLVLTVIAVLAVLCLMAFFRCEFRRLQAEGTLISERLVTGDRGTGSVEGYGTQGAAQS